MDIDDKKKAGDIFSQGDCDYDGFFRGKKKDDYDFAGFREVISAKQEEVREKAASGSEPNCDFPGFRTEEPRATSDPVSSEYDGILEDSFFAASGKEDKPIASLDDNYNFDGFTAVEKKAAPGKRPGNNAQPDPMFTSDIKAGKADVVDKVFEPNTGFDQVLLRLSLINNDFIKQIKEKYEEKMCSESDPLGFCRLATRYMDEVMACIITLKSKYDLFGGGEK